MKLDFSLFVHMERTDGSRSHAQLYEEFVQLCQMADQGGMRAIWTGEHHGMNFTIAPNPFLNLADLARRTKNVRLGTGTIIAPFWHPIKLAGEAAMTDIITDGRLEIGIARGAYSYEYERLRPGMDAWEAGQRMRETVPTLRKLWKGDYAHEGEFHKFPATTSSPQPVQDNGPPLWIAARDINSHEFAIEQGCNVQVTPLWNGDAEIDSLMEKFNEAKKTKGQGKDPKIMLLHHGYVATDEEDANEAAKTLSKFYCYFGSWFLNKRPVNQGLLKELSDEEMAGMEMYSPEVMKTNLNIGTADEMISQLKRYEKLGYDEYSLWIDSGMSFEQKKGSLQRFIDHVMPAFA